MPQYRALDPIPARSISDIFPHIMRKTGQLQTGQLATHNRDTCISQRCVYALHQKSVPTGPQVNDDPLRGFGSRWAGILYMPALIP